MATGSATTPTMNLTFLSMDASKRAVTGSSATSTTIQPSTGTGVTGALQMAVCLTTPTERFNVRILRTVRSAQMGTDLLVQKAAVIAQKSMGDAESMPLFDAQILSRKERRSKRCLMTTRWWRTRRSCAI
jgi:hypothetical protein